jgi:acyl carrier protein
MAQDTDTMKDQVRAFVMESLAKGKGIAVLSDSESLTENGVLDSLGIFRLVSFLETSFNLRIADEEITHENFQSIDAIEKFVLDHTKR